MQDLSAMRKIITIVSLRADITQASLYCNRPCADGQHANKTVDESFLVNNALSGGNLICLIASEVLL